MQIDKDDLARAAERQKLSARFYADARYWFNIGFMSGASEYQRWGATQSRYARSIMGIGDD